MVSSQPVLDLPFEELPGGVDFVDNSGYNTAVFCDAGQCPVTGIPGAPNVAFSDYGVRFDGTSDRITVNHYLSTKGNFLTGGNSDDIFGCAPSGSGVTGNCSFFAFFDGDLVGMKKRSMVLALRLAAVPKWRWPTKRMRTYVNINQLLGPSPERSWLTFTASIDV